VSRYAQGGGLDFVTNVPLHLHAKERVLRTVLEQRSKVWIVGSIHCLYRLVHTLANRVHILVVVSYVGRISRPRHTIRISVGSELVETYRRLGSRGVHAIVHFSANVLEIAQMVVEALLLLPVVDLGRELTDHNQIAPTVAFLGCDDIGKDMVSNVKYFGTLYRSKAKLINKARERERER